MPRYVDYFDSFERAAQNAVYCAELLSDLAKKGDDHGNELVTAIIKGEREGDKITHETLDRLERRYFAPIDREDVYDLIWRIDDVVDRIDAAGQRMMFYKIVVVRQDFISQCAVLLKATHLMAIAVSGLRHIKDRKLPKSTASVDQLKIVVHQAEEEGQHPPCVSGTALRWRSRRLPGDQVEGAVRTSRAGDRLLRRCHLRRAQNRCEEWLKGGRPSRPQTLNCSFARGASAEQM